MTPESAKQICIEAHKDQFRRDGVTPYSQHPIAVAELLSTDDEQVLGYLHDIIEDTDQILVDNSYGWFLYLPKIGEQPYQEFRISESQYNNLDLLTRKSNQTYADYIINISGSHLATKVKIADIFTNLQTATRTAKVKYYTALKKLLETL